MCIRAASATTQHAGRRLFFSLAALDPAEDGPDIQCSAGAAGIPLIAARQPAAASHTSHGFGAAGASLVTMARSCSCCHLWRRRRRLVPLARPGAAPQSTRTSRPPHQALTGSRSVAPHSQAGSSRTTSTTSGLSRRSRSTMAFRERLVRRDPDRVGVQPDTPAGSGDFATREKALIAFPPTWLARRRAPLAPMPAGRAAASKAHP